MRSKKAQGLTLNTVIIAVLVLIVLAILIFIAYKYIWGTGQGIGELSTCAAQKGECKNTCADDESGIFGMGGCGKGSTPGKFCCLPKET